MKIFTQCLFTLCLMASPAADAVKITPEFIERCQKRLAREGQELPRIEVWRQQVISGGMSGQLFDYTYFYAPDLGVDFDLPHLDENQKDPIMYPGGQILNGRGRLGYFHFGAGDGGIQYSLLMVSGSLKRELSPEELEKIRNDILHAFPDAWSNSLANTSEANSRSGQKVSRERKRPLKS